RHMASEPHPHEQTIEAVDPGFKRRTEPAAARPRPGRGRGRLWAVVATVAAVAALLAVFVGLPRLVQQNLEEPPPAAEPEVETVAAPPEPALSPEEIAALRSQAEALLARLLTQQQRLNAQGAAGWGGEDWRRYEELARTADYACLAEDFDAAAAGYEETLPRG